SILFFSVKRFCCMISAACHGDLIRFSAEPLHLSGGPGSVSPSDRPAPGDRGRPARCPVLPERGPAPSPPPDTRRSTRSQRHHGVGLPDGADGSPAHAPEEERAFLPLYSA